MSQINLVIVAILLVPGIGAASDSTDPIEELKNCARTEDRNDRMTCFESLGKRVLDQEVSDVPPPRKPETIVAAAPPVAPTKPATQMTQTTLPDDLGGSGFKKVTEEKKDEVWLASGHVHRCRKTRDDLWYFYFDGGQEWRQNSQGRYRFENCDFDVTISKDFFGFKMVTAGGRKIRVRRVK
jgi:hypothetical protein